MDATNKMGRTRFGVPGRYSVTIECADGLTDEEIIMMDAWFEVKVSLLQEHHRGYTDEQATACEAEALGIATPQPAVKYSFGRDVMLPASIRAEFLERFLRSCILGSEDRGNKTFIDFDNGQHVLRWTFTHGHLIGDDEILNDDEAAVVRAAWLRRKETATLERKPTDAS